MAVIRRRAQQDPERKLEYEGAVKRESQRRYSLDEYFAVEETSQVKNEYYDGQIFAMAGASLQHNRITANLLSFIRPALRDRGCEAFGSEIGRASCRERV